VRFVSQLSTGAVLAFVTLVSVACGAPQQGAAPAAPAPVTGMTSPASAERPTSQAPPPATSPRPATSAGKGSADPILRGERQVVIAVPSSESILAVEPAGRLTLTDGETGKGLFVLAPVGQGRHQLKTAKADASGEPSCMAVTSNGTTSPLTVVSTACDVSDSAQLFTIERREANDAKGRPTYAISGTGGVYLQQGRSGLIAEELGDAALNTTFTFVDNGPSTLPTVG
jgi:hypothetical protein